MKDRIEINGVWYVKEEIKTQEEFDPIFFVGIIVEDNDYCFEFTVHEENNKYHSPSFMVTYKETTPHIEEIWDNPIWLMNVYEGDLIAIKEANLSAKGTKIFKRLLTLVIEKGYLKNED